MSAAAITSAAANSNPTKSNPFAEISSEEFTRIMTAELSNQDPLDPSDTRAIMDQISSLMNIESQSALQNSLEALVSQNSVASAASLIGGTIKGLDEAGNEVTGEVASVRVINGEATYVLESGKKVAADDVLEMTKADQASNDDDAITRAMLDAATDLMGRNVAGRDDSGNAFDGEVVGVRSTDAGVVLELKDATRIRPDWITAIGDVTS